MSVRSWRASDELLKLFQSVGRASLLADIQDSHSGNMAVRIRDEMATFESAAISGRTNG